MKENSYKHYIDFQGNYIIFNNDKFLLKISEVKIVHPSFPYPIKKRNEKNSINSL